MDELTRELFLAVAGSEMDEDRLKMAFGWLAALMQMPWLEESEKQNALVLLDYLEDLEGVETLLPLCWAARAKLSFRKDTPWEMDWPENYQVQVGGEELTLEDLRRRGIEHVDFRLAKPIRESPEYAVTRRLHSDGTVEILPEYQVFTAPPIGERHVFHAYGEKAVCRVNNPKKRSESA